MARITQTDLELAVGGAANLVRLLDKDRDGVADSALVDRCINNAEAEADTALQVRHSLPITGTSAILITHESTLAAFYAHQYGTDGMGVPPSIEAAAKVSRDWFNDLAEGRRTLGQASKTATDLDVKQVDPDPLLTRVSRASLRGMW